MTVSAGVAMGDGPAGLCANTPNRKGPEEVRGDVHVPVDLPQTIDP